MKPEFLIVGAGLGGLSTALRLVTKGYNVTILEKHTRPGGRLNLLEIDGYKFDLGPTFMSMTYELKELFDSCGIDMPVEMEELDPLYRVYFEDRKEPFYIWKDLQKLSLEFSGIEPDMAEKADIYLKKAAEFFHDTEDKVIRSNFSGKLQYLMKLTGVPIKHLPYLFKTMWQEVDKTFTSDEVKIIFSLVAFFLGAPPFETPAVYSLLNYTEMRHNGYWKVKGGMYKLIEELEKILIHKGVTIHYNTEVVDYIEKDGVLDRVLDQRGKEWKRNIFIINSDAAGFRGKIFKRKRFSEKKLDKLHWTLAPFTIYLGLDTKLDTIGHHNYFLGKDFKSYSDTLFTSSESPKKPYYYVCVSSKSYPNYAPEGGESVFILCPVPDLRYKKDWSDKEYLADTIIDDISNRIGTNLKSHVVVKKILDPVQWGNMFNLYKGSGLGLAHDMDQVGAFRPANKDEKFSNVYYVGASTIPGTGLPMVVISSKLVLGRIFHEHADL